LVMVLMMAVAGGPASAISDNASDRACVGAFLSTVATTVQPVGQVIQEEAKLFHPLGQTVVSPFATTCEDPEG
jgi:hypothetical protein